MSRRCAAAGVSLVLVLIVCMSRSGGHTARAAAQLNVAMIGAAGSAAYPTVAATFSVVDSTTGRPVTELNADEVTASDDAGKVKVLSVTAANRVAVPTAYVLLFDTSGGIQPYLSQVQTIARQFVAKLGPNDVVRVIRFNDGTDEQSSNWVRRDDPNLAAQINALQSSPNFALVTDAMIRASDVASAPPEGFSRRAVVAFVNVDGKRDEPDLTVETIKSRLPTATFTFGFGQPPAGEETLTFFLEDLAQYTGGAYWPVGSPKYPADPIADLLDITQRTWDIAFTADGLPDGKQHKLTLDVRDSTQRNGEDVEQYTAGTLLKVSPVSFGGIKDGDVLTSDRDLTLSVGGHKAWQSTSLQLFRDCNTLQCNPVATSAGSSLQWKLVAQSLGQGAHTLTARLTASDGQHEFTDSQTIRFSRSGTTFNPELMFLFGGIAVVAIGGTGFAIRRRRPETDEW